MALSEIRAVAAEQLAASLHCYLLQITVSKADSGWRRGVRKRKQKRLHLE
jgi:hypothetical protein